MMPKNNDGSHYQAGLVYYTNNFIRKEIVPTKKKKQYKKKKNHYKKEEIIFKLQLEVPNPRTNNTNVRQQANTLALHTFHLYNTSLIWSHAWAFIYSH